MLLIERFRLVPFANSWRAVAAVWVCVHDRVHVNVHRTQNRNQKIGRHIEINLRTAGRMQWKTVIISKCNAFEVISKPLLAIFSKTSFGPLLKNVFWSLSDGGEY